MHRVKFNEPTDEVLVEVDFTVSETEDGTHLLLPFIRIEPIYPGDEPGGDGPRNDPPEDDEPRDDPPGDDPPGEKRPMDVRIEPENTNLLKHA